MIDNFEFEDHIGKKQWMPLETRGRHLVGSSEDLAATIAWDLSGRSTARLWLLMITFRLVFWDAIGPSGERRVLLSHRGRVYCYRSGDWIEGSGQWKPSGIRFPFRHIVRNFRKGRIER